MQREREAGKRRVGRGTVRERETGGEKGVGKEEQSECESERRERGRLGEKKSGREEQSVREKERQEGGKEGG